MLKVDSPPDLGYLQAVIRKIANFEFEADDFIKEDIWGFKEEEYLSHYVLQAGYDSNVLMFSMGLELYFTFGFLILLSVISLVVCLKCCHSIRIDKMKAFKDRNLYNGLIAVFLESTLETSIALSLTW